MKATKERMQDILSRGVEEIHVRKSLEKRLSSGKKLRIKHGIDPTGPKIHIGRASTLWKLRDFQDLGHKIILIIGDYTAQIGDPSDKLTKRPFLSEKQIKENMKMYKKQLGMILDMKKVEIEYNSKWLAKLTPRELDNLADLFSVQQMMARRNFKERWEKEEEISIRELHYPLYQGYDSVIVKADIEIGGSDQLFNLLAGRKIQEAHNQKPQDILTTKMLLGTDGRKMSTSWGNVINLTDKPGDIYGKIMSIADELIIDYFTLCTCLSLEKIKKFEKDLHPPTNSITKAINHQKSVNRIGGGVKLGSPAIASEALRAGKNPRDFKMILAYEVVKLYHGKKVADKAQEGFVKVFQKKEIPDKILIKKVQNKQLFEILVEIGLSSSKNEARRVIEQGGVKIDGKVVKNAYFEPKIGKKGVLIQKGKRYFVRVIK